MGKIKVAAVIPCYKVANTIKQVLLLMPEIVEHVIVVDDACPEGSGKEAEKVKRDHVLVLYHKHNRGVGAAVVTGYRKADELGCDIVVKIDGDGQMDPAQIERLIAPLVSDEADYTKGNRFRDFTALKSMPKIRLFGNSGLSFLVKVASGYWNIMDPTNGFTAIHGRLLKKLSVDKLSKRFFFESDMLIQLNLLNAVVRDVNIAAKYGEEQSGLSIWRAVFQFPLRLAGGFIKRIFFKYFIYDFNMASVYTLIGLPVFLSSVSFGIYEWIDSILTGQPRTAGTIMLVALPIIVSFQMLLQAINIDINSVPKKNS